MSVLIAFVVFSVLVLIHEFGHFLLAKKNGVCVTEFSLGMGPRIVSFEKGGTRYSWKLVPFGGSCAMLGEDEEIEDEQNKEGAFGSKSVWARISVVAAGPIFNFILAFVLALLVIGFVGADQAKIVEVDSNSPAAQAGLKEGDIVKKYRGSGISVGREMYLQDVVSPISSQTVSVTVLRDGKKQNIEIQPEKKEKYVVGMKYSSSESNAVIEVVEGGALEKAGLKTDDCITKIDGNEIKNAKEMQSYLQEHPFTKDMVEITVMRNGKEITAKVTPEKGTDYYYTGFSYNLAREKMSGLESVKYSCFEIKYQVKSVFKSLGMLVSGKLTKDDIAGPVGIVDIISDTVHESKSDGMFMVFLNIMNLTICLSANLGVMNLLPLPALDGGRLVFMFLEIVRGKPVPKEKEGMVHFAGMVVLMILMVFIMFNDISRLFRG